MAAAAAATAASKPPLPDLPALPPPLRQDPNQTLQLLLFAALACRKVQQVQQSLGEYRRVASVRPCKTSHAAAADTHNDGMTACNMTATSTARCS